jgi:hypothetical protein
MNKTLNIIFLVIVAGLAFFYRGTIENIWVAAYNRYFPCRSPISYSLGSFDARFGISQKDFLDSLGQAENIWEKALGKNLFQYSQGGNLKVNLVYDKRQETTKELSSMGITVKNDRASYDALKIKYDDLLVTYSQTKSQFQVDVSAFQARESAYNTEVSALNRKGKASPDDISRLKTEAEYLNNQSAILNQRQTELSKMVDEINALAGALNQLATSLNIDVKKYNTVGSSLGGEFEEGTYISGPLGQEIDIYQFENKTKLVRVLAHELGHALGLDHNEDPKAIMYRLNDGINEKLTVADITALKNLCGIK